MSLKRVLVGVFEAYTGSISTPMTSSKFIKIMKDSNLLDSNLKQPDVDLIFTKCKQQGQKTIDLEGFKRGLEMIAARKGVSYADLLDYIHMTTGDGPSYAGTTVAQENRFYDDKETYTGVHKAGGPTVVDRDKQGLESLLDRSDADVRGLKRDMKEAHGRPVMAGRRDEFDSPHSPSPGSQRSARAPITLSPRDNSQEAIIENLESRLQRLSATSSPDPSQAQSKISTPQTLAAHISNRLSQPVTPPTAPAVTAYPSHHNAHSSPPPAPPSQSRGVRAHADLPPTPPVPVRAASQTPQTPVRDTEAALLERYKSFCTNDPEGKEMDSARFVKFCRDTKLIGSVGHLTSVDADLIFQKSKKAGNYGKKITYEDFRMVAIPELAKRIGCSVEEIFAAVFRSEGPTLNNTTTPSEVRFHDDLSTYTGVHAEGHNPSFTPTSSRVTLEDLLDRSPADNRGIKLSANATAAPNSSGQKPKRPVIAGEANKPGGIYDRLSQQDSYTGVYRERFIQQPSSPNEFRGHTNTGSDVPVHDISQVLNRR